MKHLRLKCKPLDDLLGGGIESNAIMEVYGESGSGKSNLCLQASRECVAYGKKAAYIDSGGVSVERLRQICRGYDYQKILTNILFFIPRSFEEQEEMVNKIVKFNDVGLIVIDTINRFYRIKLKDDEAGANRSLIRQITKLQLFAREKDICVILTEDVYTTNKNDVKPFIGRDIKHIAKTRLKLEKIAEGKRKAIIMKHRFQAKGKNTFFTITENGLE